MPIISIDSARATEGDYMYFTLRLSEAAADAVTVDYAAMSGTALRGELGSTLDGQVVFAAGETTKTIRIYAGYDSLDELDESFFLELRNPNGASFGTNTHSLSAVGWALDNDGPGSNRAIAVSDAVIAEAGGGKAVFTVSLSQPYDTDRSFSFRTFDGSAKAASDYVARTGTVTFLAGQTEATVEIGLVNNNLAEATERFGLAITGAHGVAGATGTAQVQDDDSAVPVLSIDSARATEGDYMYFTVRLSEAAADAVTVDYAALPGTASQGELGYTLQGQAVFAAGETVKTIRIYAGYDSLDELDESFFIELRNPTGATFGTNTHSLSAVGWVLDNDGPGSNRAIAVSDAVITEAGGGKAVFTVSLSQAYDTDRSFSFRTFDGSAKAASDYVARTGTVTFLAGQTEATVEIGLVNNNLAEATERFGLAITGAHGVAGATGTAQVQDDDSAVPVLSIDSARATEGDYMYFTVRLSEAAADAVTVDYAALPGTASQGELGYTLQGQAVFAAGETVKTIRIYAGYDSLDELDESFFIELRNPTGATFGGGNRTILAGGWVLDDDGPALNRTVAVQGANIVEGPGGRVAVFAVEISSAHNAPLTLNYQTVNGTALAGRDYAAASGQVTFAAGQTRAEITVPIFDDLTPEANEHFYLRVAPPFPPAISASSNIATGTGTIIDGTLRGTAGNDVLRGTEGADGIAGYDGHDRLLGLGGNDRLWGGTGNDTLDGGTGADTMIGGAGNDSYGLNGSDTVVEEFNGGIDTAYSVFTATLAANVENLVLTGSWDVNGTGNALANVMVGNAGRNIFGGGAGNDTYVIGAGDRVIEAVNAGIDTVRTGATHVLSANVENLVLLGAGNINGTGNALANVMVGNAGRNIFGGGAGNDTYVIGAGDRVIEAVNAGIDTVRTGVTHVLSANVENLVLLGAGNINGTGNGLANYLAGNAGANVLSGGAGADTLNGGAGADILGGGSDTARDVFVFSHATDFGRGGAVDQVFGFVSGIDRIDLSALDANSRLGGNQDFVFSGTSARSNAVWYERWGSNLVLRGDHNGDAGADFALVIRNESSLRGDDFIF